MVRWQGVHDEKLELFISGYELPELSEGWAANRLVVELEAKNEQGVWVARSACLFTWEVYKLLRWFEAVVVGTAESQSISFHEPELQLCYLARAQGRHRLVASLSGSVSFGRATTGGPSILALAITDDQVFEACDDLERIIEEYPPRGAAAREAMDQGGSRGGAS